MNVEYDDGAIDDLDQIENHVAQDRPLAARRLRGRLIDACERLADFPQIGRRSHQTRLRELTTVPPYFVFYSLGADAVRIRRIIHGARLR